MKPPAALILLALLTLSACASARTFDAVTRDFERHWQIDTSPTEIARIGVRSSTFRGGWTIVSAAVTGDRRIVARRTDGDWNGDISKFTGSSEDCSTLNSLAEDLSRLRPPTPRGVWPPSESPIVIESHSASVRLRMGALYTDEEGRSRLATVTFSAYGETPLLEWYGRARTQLEQCWTRVQ